MNIDRMPAARAARRPAWLSSKTRLADGSTPRARAPFRKPSGSGFERATALSAYFSQRVPRSDVLPEPSEATIRYVLGTTVPENWIPFVATHKPGSQRLIRLQRASMPRLTDAIPDSRVEPRGTVLRVGLDGGEVRQPYFLHQEEVPRAGAIVTRVLDVKDQPSPDGGAKRFVVVDAGMNGEHRHQLGIGAADDADDGALFALDQVGVEAELFDMVDDVL